METRRDVLKDDAITATGPQVIVEECPHKDNTNVFTTDWCVVNVSVCNLRQSASHTAIGRSQALLGTPLRILQKSTTWWEVEAPDHLTAWVHPSALKEVTREELSEWNHQRQVVVTATYAFVYQLPSAKAQTVSDVVAGDRLKLINCRDRYFYVEYPDGRQGFIRRADSEELSNWRERITHTPASIINTAQKLMGIPDMAGGTSTKGVDADGLIRTILIQHDILVPHDMIRLANIGVRIFSSTSLDNLNPGDLLVFGDKDENKEGDVAIKHIGLYIGNGEFIHCYGWVKTNSLLPTGKNYDKYYRDHLLWAQRFLPFVNKSSDLKTTDQIAMYQ